MCDLYLYALNVCFVFTTLIHNKVGSAQEISKDLTSHPHWKLLDRGDECGHNVADRIIGGEKASLGQYPWIARLGYALEYDPDNMEVEYYECGGAIISERYVLSAAHCSPEMLQLALVQVRLGEHDLTTDIDCSNAVCAPPVQDIYVEEYYCHEGYSNETLHNDICLLRLEQPIKFNDFVAPICLPFYDIFQDNDFKRQSMEVAGWGVIDSRTEKTSEILLTLNVPVVDTYLCCLTFSGQVDIVDTQICAGGVIGKDSCSGDSGGPLMKPFSVEAPPRYFVIGIVSFGPKRCAETNSPGVYTLVSKYLEWILDNIYE